MGLRGQGHLYRQPFLTRSGERRLVQTWYWKAPTGRRYNTGKTSREEAERWVCERVIELRDGIPIAAALTGPVRYDDLERMLLDDWQAKERRGIPSACGRLKHLNHAFSGWSAAAITTDKVTAYAIRRRKEGAAVATVNFEIALLHRAFVLAKRAGRLRDVPIMDRLPGGHHRTGTVDPGDLDAIERVLEPRYADVIEALYWTGWREGEILRLTWQRVDLAACEIRLDRSKSGEPRVLCFASVPALITLFREAHQRRGFSPYVFPGRAGRPIDRTTLQKHWRAACRASRLPDTTLIHDLRRTAVRDLRRAGVPLAVAMGAVGHRSLDVHQGYSVVARQDQDEGMARLVALRKGEPVQRRLAVMGG